jgi:hypothetical protein
MAWEEITQGYPESGHRVMFSWLNSHGKRRTSIGYYAGKLALLAEDHWDNFDDIDGEYFVYALTDPDCTTPYLPEGWFEEGAEGEYCHSISGGGDPLDAVACRPWR